MKQSPALEGVDELVGGPSTSLARVGSLPPALMDAFLDLGKAQPLKLKETA